MADNSARRFLTRTDVEDAAKTDRSLQLGARDVITDEAAQRARDLGVALTRTRGVESGPPAGTHPTSADTAALRRAVRAAVISELGREPAGLDAALDKVLARTHRS